MGKKLVIPSYKKILATRKREIDKQIREAQRPIFNLWRLAHGPCHRFSCSSKHTQNRLAALIIALLGGWTCAILMTAVGLTAWIALRLPYEMLVGRGIYYVVWGWVFTHLMSACSWNTHEDELATEREHLTKQLLPSTLLRDSLRDDIDRVRTKLLYKGGDLERWREALDTRTNVPRSRNASETQIQSQDGSMSYRSAPGGVRIELADERDALLRAKAGIHTLQRTSRERLEQLMDDADALGSMLDMRTTAAALPLTQETAKTSLARIDAAIQRGVEAFHTELDQLQKNGSRACIDAGSALAADIAADAEDTALGIQRENLLKTKP